MIWNDIRAPPPILGGLYMGKYRDHRSSRSDRFDDREPGDSEPSYFQRRPEERGTTPAPVPVSATSLPVFDAEVLWFNAEKGFGFARLSDGSDAFLHISKLEAAGHSTLGEGAKLEVRIEVGHKGPQVGEIVSVRVVNDSHVPLSPTPTDLTGNSLEQKLAEEESIGSVKRYDTAKGFGFIKLENGGGDVFVHATTLTRDGISTLEPGQQVVVRYARGQKGLEARSLHLP